MDVVCGCCVGVGRSGWGWGWSLSLSLSLSVCVCVCVCILSIYNRWILAVLYEHLVSQQYAFLIVSTHKLSFQGNISSLVKVYKAKKFKTLSLCPDASPAISESPRVKLLWLKRYACAYSLSSLSRTSSIATSRCVFDLQ